MKKILLYIYRFCFLHIFPERLKNRIYIPFFERSKLLDDVELKIQIVEGIRLRVTPKDWVQYCLLIRNYYEKKETAFVTSFLQKGNTFVDIGANIGYYSLIASKKVGQTGKVYSFEPVTRTFNRLKDNITLNEAHNILINKMAMSNVSGEITINVGDDQNWGMSSITKHNHLSGFTEKIKASTLDAYVEENNIAHIDLIKIDIEGAEFLALQGMEQVMRRFKPVILLELIDDNLIKAGASVKEVFEWFRERNFKAYSIHENGIDLTEIDTPCDSELMVFKTTG